MATDHASSDFDSAVPLHHRIYVILRQQINEGLYQGDGQIPAEQELSRAFGVSRITVRRALERLQREGLVTRARGRGTFARTPLVPPAVRTNQRGIFENLVAMGLGTRVRRIEFGYVPAPPAVAEKLRIEPGETVQRAVRVRYHENEPFSHLTTYLPEAIGRRYTEADMAETPLLLLLERAGVQVSAADQSITAKLADPIVAPLLRVEAGSPLLWVKRVVLDRQERPVEFLHALYRPDMYEYQMTMSRVDGESATFWSPDATTA